MRILYTDTPSRRFRESKAKRGTKSRAVCSERLASIINNLRNIIDRLFGEELPRGEASSKRDLFKVRLLLGKAYSGRSIFKENIFQREVSLKKKTSSMRSFVEELPREEVSLRSFLE